MYEEYLEDYVYKFIAKVGSKICRIFKSKNRKDKVESETTVALQEDSAVKSQKCDELTKESLKESSQQESESDKTDEVALINTENDKQIAENDIDEDLNNLNFHMTMFFLWMMVTIVNIPALLTWARNFKYSMVLKPDTSYVSGLTLSICSTVIWQQEGPRKNLKNYDSVATLLFVMAIIIITLGPFTLAVINYVVPFVFAIITLQQVFDHDNDDDQVRKPTGNIGNEKKNKRKSSEPTKDNEDENNAKEHPKEQPTGSKDQLEDNCDVCNEGRIYSMFKNLRDKFSFNNDV